MNTTAFRRIKKYQFGELSIKKATAVYSRGLTILQSVLISIVHKGNTFVKIHKTKYNVGFNFGVFSFTRRPYVYKIIKKKKKNNLLTWAKKIMKF